MQHWTLCLSSFSGVGRAYSEWGVERGVSNRSNSNKHMVNTFASVSWHTSQRSYSPRLEEAVSHMYVAIVV